MKNWFRKYWWAVLLAAVVLCLVILVDIFNAEYWPAGWVFNFLDSWALVLSAAATVTLAAVAFWTVRKNVEQTRKVIEEGRHAQLEERHRQALERIRDWAEEVFSVTTMPTRHKNIEMRKSELVSSLHRTGAKTIGIQKDAEQVGGNMYLIVGLANLAIFKFDARLRGKDDIAQFKARYNITDTIEPIRNLQELEDARAELLNAIADVINAATEQLVPLR